MFSYFLLLTVTAFFSYTFASIGTRRVASALIFHRNLFRLGKGNVWISNFRRLYKAKGVILLTLTEVVKDALPILLGGLLLSLKGQAEVGRAFAGFCVVMARLWPLFNRLRGCHGCVGLAVAGLMLSPSVGIASAVVCLGVTLLSRYLTLGALGGAAILIITSFLVVENRIAMLLLAASGGLVFFRNLLYLRKLMRGGEEKLSFREDLTYKLDEKF